MAAIFAATCSFRRSPPTHPSSQPLPATNSCTQPILAPPPSPHSSPIEEDGYSRKLTSAEYTAALRVDEAEVGALMSSYGFKAERPSPCRSRASSARATSTSAIKAIGYDMDYTLIDYKMVLLEERVYHYSKEFLRSRGFPVSGLRFNHELVVRGLIVDTLLGHVLKVDRFGYVRRAMHGSRVLSQG